MAMHDEAEEWIRSFGSLSFSSRLGRSWCRAKRRLEAGAAVGRCGRKKGRKEDMIEVIRR
jgi:hypothetical protein